MLFRSIASEWESVIDRIGRWVEFKNAYKTMDQDYMESVWWAFSQLYQKGLIYEDVRVSLFCPRCSTPLSNFEIAMDNSYEMDSDPSVFVKMKLASEENAYFLVWTTTPWTLPANVALAVGDKIEYAKVAVGNEKYFLAKEKVESLFKDKGDYKIIETFKGTDLVDMKYQPIFPHEIENGYRVIAGDFVTTEDGTGIVHIAPAFGEDDFRVRKPHGLPIITNVDEEGQFLEGEWRGQKVWEANGEIVKWLKENDFLFKREQITHSYPHCHRCHAKLIYKAQAAWYVNVDKLRAQLLEKNENINWYPEFLKHGRFQKGIETAPDWNISRDRYFGTAIPVWKCDGKAQLKTQNSKLKTEEERCDNIKVVGSYEELKTLSGVELEDYHRPGVDEITFKCEKCGGKMKRIPQVFDSWIESGSMPFAQFHYPFENKEIFEKSFPTDFISEYIAQTRAWFYVLHVISVGIFDRESFKNVVTTGTIGGNDGKKMSKSLGNYTLPDIVLEKYSADALRFYLLSSPLLNAQNINFSEKAIADIQRKLLATLWNSYSFFMLYAGVDNWRPDYQPADLKNNRNFLDRWIISELNVLISQVDDQMQKYNLVAATKPFELFVDNLSNWYIRRSRKRFWKSENDADKNEAYRTLHFVLVELSKLMAPFCPFMAEEIFKSLIGGDSVHLEDYPVGDSALVDEELCGQMKKVREIVSMGLQLRAAGRMKVRQPLAQLQLVGYRDLTEEQMEIIKEEMNVKKVSLFEKATEGFLQSALVQVPISKGNNFSQMEDEKTAAFGVALDVDLTEELKQEGMAREIIRVIQGMRKEAGLEVSDHIQVAFSADLPLLKNFSRLIAKEILADEIGRASCRERV